MKRIGRKKMHQTLYTRFLAGWVALSLVLSGSLLLSIGKTPHVRAEETESSSISVVETDDTSTASETEEPSESVDRDLFNEPEGSAAVSEETDALNTVPDGVSETVADNAASLSEESSAETTEPTSSSTSGTAASSVVAQTSSEVAPASLETEPAESTSASETISVTSSETTFVTASENSSEGTSETASPKVAEVAPGTGSAKKTASYEATTESGIRVRAEVPYGAFPVDVTMQAEDVALNSEIIGMANDSISEDQILTGAVAVDIRFVDPQGTILEPLSGYRVQVSIELPQEQKLEGNTFSVLHVNDEGAEVVEEADVDENGGNFVAESFSVYVLTAVGEMNGEKVHDYLPQIGVEEWIDENERSYVPNNLSFPYLLQQGETVTLVAYSADLNARFSLDSTYGYNSDTNSFHVTEKSQKQSTEMVTDTEGNIGYRHEVVYSADSPGIARVTFGTGGQGDSEEFYIGIVPPHTSGVREFDMRSDWSLAEYNTPNNPYCVEDGDILRVISDNNWFSFIRDDSEGRPQGANGGDMYLYRFGDGEAIPGGHYNDLHASRGSWWKYSYISGCTVWCGSNHDSKRTIYFKVMPGSVLDHADIEIADGGRYTSTNVYVKDGNLYKQVDVYDTYVSGVNECILYQSADDSQTVRFFNTNGETLMYDADHPRTGFLSGEYHQNITLTADDPQFELTSKYDIDTNGDPIDGTWSTVRFNYYDVDHATFDVKMLRIPTGQFIYKYNPGSDQWEQQSYEQITNGKRQVLNHVVFHLTHKHVVDAYNKCPNHSGLDFTIHANAAMIQLSASKQLLHGTLEGGDFTFVLEDAHGNVVGQASNNVNGAVLFDEMHFEEPGTYTYTLREIPDNTKNNIHFDETTYTVTIEVKKRNIDGLLEAEITLPHKSLEDVNYQFVNEVMFTLPDTGGGGTKPFLVTGMALILSAAILLLLKKARVMDL